MTTGTDLRASLASAGAPPGAGDEGIAAPEYFELDTMAPAEVSAAGSRTWLVRGQNLVVAYTRLRAGDTLARTGQPHDYLVLLTDPAAEVRVQAGGEDAAVTGAAVVVVPPGDSVLAARVDTTVVRAFDARSTDLLDRCHNAASYARPHPRVAPLEPWPDPVGGHRLRVYPVADHPRRPGSFGRLFRTSTLMVNFGDPVSGPRDPGRMSPHHHDDFEQISLTLSGEYVHHVRTPWGARLAEWRDDEHRAVGSPSVTVIPPPTVHTSQATGTGTNHLVDLFSPPRADFSAKPGWVRNADEYPAP
ncbi:cupin domain-containing protein [Phytohabitans suffuscus]